MRYLNVKQVAEMVGAHPETIRRAISDGKLHAVRPKGGRVWRILPEWVTDWAQGEESEVAA